MRPYNIVHTFYRSDNKRSAVVTERNGFFSFHEEGEEVDLGETFWTTLSGGGTYETAHEAEKAARLEIPWLRDQHEYL